MTRGSALLLAVTAVSLASAGAAGPDAALVETFRAECAARHEAAEAAWQDANASYTAAVAAGDEAAAERHAAAAEASMVVAGADGWLFLTGELRHVSVGRFWGEAAGKVSRASRGADPLPAILDYKAQLDRLGIELILLPVPPKAIVYADKLCPAVKLDARGVPPRLDTAHQAFYKLLGEKGVTVLDLTRAMLAARAAKGPELYCKQDTHFSGRACVLAAREIRRMLGGRKWVKAISRRTFESQRMEVQISGDLWRSLKRPRPPRESLPLRFVGTRGPGGLVPVQPDAGSPILLLADSHGLIFHLGEDMHAKGAGLADQLAMEFSIPVECLAVRGSGATPARISLYRKQRRIDGYLASKKVLIWCFAARELTESSGWRKVPVTREVPKER
jgi:hypothetical protein